MEESVKFLSITPRNIQYCLSNLSNIVFEVTDACNLSCTYCGYSDLYSRHDARKDKFMRFDLARAVIDYVIDFWHTHASPAFPKRLNIGFYGGEPLLNITLIEEIVDYIEKQENIGKALSYSMTTNGVLLDKHIDFLAEKKFRLLVSLDGDEEAHSYRVDKQGNNSFTQVYNNVKYVQKYFSDYFKKHVAFNSVLHNKNDIAPIYDFFVGQFSKASTISSLNPDGVKKEKACIFDEMCNNYVESFYKVEDKGSIEKKENFWLSMHPEAFLFIDEKKLLLYHSKNYTYLEIDSDPFINDLYTSLTDVNNMYCAKISEANLQKYSNFIEKISTMGFGDEVQVAAETGGTGTIRVQSGGS